MMKVKVADLEPNPYRKMEHYPVDKAKVEALKTSITEKTFWDNILARPHGQKYQLAYGHHRWIALKELGIKEIDIPIRDIDNASMVQIMAEENLNWSTSPAVMTQTVLTAKEFLDAELAKYETWKDFSSGEIARTNLGINTEPAFRKLKGDGVGRDTLVKFLGGNWTDYKVRVALDIIKDKDLDSEAVNTIPTMKQATVFRSAVKKHKISKPTQKKIAKTITREGVGVRDIPDLVAEHSVMPEKREKTQPKSLPMLDDVVREICSLMNDLHKQLNHVKLHVNSIQSARLRAAFIRDGKELTKIMKEIFGNETETEKMAEKKKRILSDSR